MQQFFAGLDVGSTTVKTVVCSANDRRILFHKYVRHESHQAETVFDSVREIKRELSISDENLCVFMTGSGGHRLAEPLGARFVQEVAAVSSAVETGFPDVRSVIELGGQDAKMIFFQESCDGSRMKKIATMNDKCAGGTGVVIEKIAAKLHISSHDLHTQSYDYVQVYPIAGKCGVFAETDITGLQKQGVPPDQLMASLFQAVVLQNLSVLTRGHTLRPKVFLLGGPNAFFPGLQAAWRKGLLDLWTRKNIAIPSAIPPEELVVIPPMAEYFAAVGAIQFGTAEQDNAVQYKGTYALEEYIRRQDLSARCPEGPGSLRGSLDEFEHFRKTYSLPSPVLPRSCSNSGVFIGLDGGSTSTKAVALSEDGEVIASSYRLSQTDPISDAVAVLRELRDKLLQAGLSTQALGLGTTGYSKGLLAKALSADVALVETVAHAQSSLRVFPDADAIIDVGGQDIKIIVLRDGTVKDFKLNTQCSAGNGYFLQAAAESIGIPVEDFADAAFRAHRMPEFSYGCAVFLQSDIVNFQRQGWKPEEILAGLAAVLPKNIFLYVAGVSNVAALGRRFVLQGGTQRNLAVVKAELDFIRKHYHGDGEPEVFVHPHCCEAGAIGAALEAIDLWKSGHSTVFRGFQALDVLRYAARRDETTRCHFCANRCLRTFVELTSETAAADIPRRIIVATCERGEAEDASTAKTISTVWAGLRQSSPNYVQLAAEQAWQSMSPESTHTAAPRRALLPFLKNGLLERQDQRSRMHIGIPRALNLFTYAPLFSAYFESLGVPSTNLHYSHFTNPGRYQEAAGFSAVDPCFPSKVSTAHVFDLLQQSKQCHLDAIFFPMFDVLATQLDNCSGSSACPSGSATPEAVKANFSRAVDWFREAHVRYLNPILDLADRDLFTYQMFACWKDLLHLDWAEHTRAVGIAFSLWETFEARFRQRASLTLNELEHSGNIGLVMLGRPYHHDPGLNQGILEELNRLGYPIFSQNLLPLGADLLARLFGAEVDAGVIRSPLDISDVWKSTFSASSNQKIWAAKFVARHPNLISVELSNFKCGHDAFISRVIEQVIEQSGKPHFSFRDLDENRPLASIRIRIETMHYFLRHYRERLQAFTSARLSIGRTELSATRCSAVSTQQNTNCSHRMEIARPMCRSCIEKQRPA